MIKIRTSKDHIIIDGHADYNNYGKDIVCASVSSIVITSINAIIRLDNKALEVHEKEGYIDIKIIKHTKETDILITNMLELLKSLEQKYNKNIQIKEAIDL